MGGINSDVSYSVTTDAAGNVFISGYFQGTVDFNPGAAIDNHVSAGPKDIFLTKINANGSYGWTKTLGGTSRDESYSVTTDAAGNVFISGYFQGTVDFDPGAAIDNHVSAGFSDIFLTKINANGSYGWTKTMGGTGFEAGRTVTTDTAGNVFISGYFQGTVDFDPGAAIDNHASAGFDDIFLTKINANGSYGWTKTLGGTGYDLSFAVTTDAAGNVFISGNFSGTVDFDPGAAIDNHASAGFDDIFLTKIDLVAPTLSEITPIPLLDNNPTPSYTFFSNEAGSITYTGSCSSGTFNAVAGNNTITLNMLGDGIYSNCSITVTDASSFTSAPLQLNTFTIDLTAPSAPIIILPANNTITNNTIRPTIMGWAEDGSAVTLQSGLSSIGFVTATGLGVNWSVVGGQILTEGVHSFVATATDPVGNSSIISLPIIYTVDTTPPVLLLKGAAKVVVNAGGYYVDKGVSALDTVDGNLSQKVVKGGNFVDTSSPGTYTITYDVMDTAGNPATQQMRTVQVNAVATPTAAAPAASGGGGGCVISPSASFDPVILMMLLGAMVSLRRRRTTS